MVSRLVSLKTSILVIVATCTLPLLILLLTSATQNYEYYKRDVYSELQLQAERSLDEAENEILQVQTKLRELAAHPAMRSGDWPKIHELIVNASPSGMLRNISVIDRQGNQRLNSSEPLGKSLPSLAKEVELLHDFDKEAIRLSKVMVSPLTRLPCATLSVPVYIAKTPNERHRLVFELDLSSMSHLLKQSLRSDQLLVALVDDHGTIAARSLDSEKFAGSPAYAPLWDQIRNNARGTLESVSKEGVPVATAFIKSRRWNWAVAVGAPKAIIESELRKLLFMYSLTVVLMLVIISLICFHLFRLISSSLHDLELMGIGIQEGAELTPPLHMLKETRQASEALLKASQMSNQIRHQAMHDALTGLPNRGLFFQQLDQFWAKATRHGTSFAILVLDLDRFKEVNDSSGHQAGDLVLQEVASRIASNVRADDVAARLGGDEFAILLNESSPEGALGFAQRLLPQLVIAGGDGKLPVTASIGLAMWNKHVQNQHELLERADRAMYHAKSESGNQVQIDGSF